LEIKNETKKRKERKINPWQVSSRKKGEKSSEVIFGVLIERGGERAEKGEDFY